MWINPIINFAAIVDAVAIGVGVINACNIAIQIPVRTIAIWEKKGGRKKGSFRKFIKGEKRGHFVNS
ncbi:MAG: hypothetical protein CML13_00105 [Puniceicoccaceae bacterium]|nr:hypothetical protein [Puniceicoccaceae bacterium]